MNPEELVDQFMKVLQADKKAEATVDSYAYHASQFLDLINKHPRDATVEDVKAYKAMMASRLAARSIIVGLAAVRSFLESHDNFVANRVKRIREPKQLPIVLTEGEIKRLLDAASKDPLSSAAIATLYWTGIRNGSLCKLDMADILWEEHRLVLREAKRGKTYTVFIPDQALEAIKAYLPYREEPVYTKDLNALFINPNTRERVRYNSIIIRVKKAAVKAGITKRVYPHLLRHTHGTVARNHGLPLDSIAHQLGHESVATTQIYAQLADEVYEQEYQSFFAGKPAKRPLHKQPTTFQDADGWMAYR